MYAKLLLSVNITVKKSSVFGASFIWEGAEELCSAVITIASIVFTCGILEEFRVHRILHSHLDGSNSYSLVRYGFDFADGPLGK
ncbi:hypothetical protein Q1695_001331 [Nippostrongylus brasiliensis]|nr:hypothetical protein Q1695_001331 [Nippostrongylus brasiliensis]